MSEVGDHPIRTERELTTPVSFLPTDRGVTVDIVEGDFHGSGCLSIT